MNQPTLFYTNINVRDMDEALHFFCDICGMEKVGPCEKDYPSETLSYYQKELIPRLFGLEEKDVRFRSQLIAPKGRREAFYELFEWITPKWTEIIKYVPSNHVGIFRSNVVVEGFDDLMKKCEAYEGCDFVAPHEAIWMSPNTENKDAQPSMARMRFVRHNSGAILQCKGEYPRKSYLDDTPGRVVSIRHRAEHVHNFDKASDFFLDKIGATKSTFDADGGCWLSTAPYFNEPYRHYLTEWQLQELFAYDRTETPICNAHATYLGVKGLDGKPQNFDVYEWVAPKAVGEPYPTVTHIGFQRFCWFVDDFDLVKERVNDGVTKVVCKEVSMPAYTIPDSSITATRAMSFYDVDGVFHIVLGK